MRRAVLAVEAAAALAIAATVAHAWLPLANPVGLAVQTALSFAAWRAAGALEHLEWLGAVSDLRVLLQGLLLGGLIAAPLWAVRTPPSPKLRRVLTLWTGLGALPALVGLGAVITFGGGLSGGWLLPPLLGVLIGAHRRERASAWAPIDLWEQRGPITIGCLMGAPAFLMLHALYVSGPGIQPLVVADSPALAGLAQGLPGGPVARIVAQGLALGVAAAGALLWVRRGGALLPRLMSGPAGWLPPLTVIGLVGLVSAAPAQFLDVWRCPPAEPPLVQLHDAPGTFQLAAIGDSLWVNIREARRTLRISAAGDVTETQWNEVHPDSWPEELIPLPSGEVWIGLVAPSAGEQTLMAVLGPDGAPRGAPFVVPGCYVASWTWLEDRRQLLVGCEYQPEFLVLDPTLREVVERHVVDRLGSVEEVVIDPGTKQVVAVPLWFGSWLSALDLDAGEVVRSTFVGDFNWGAALDEESRTLYLSRFHEGRVVAIDLADLSVAGHWEADWGVRPLELVRDDWLVAAGTFSGRLRAIDLRGEQQDRVLRVGGGVRSLDARGDQLWLGGRCGVAEVDLASWLRRD